MEEVAGDHEVRYEDEGEKAPSLAEVPIGEVTSKEALEAYNVPIGRIAITERTPTTPSKFTFWIKDDASIDLEPGDFVKVLGANGLIIAQVTGIEARKSVSNPIDEFYSSGYGDPSYEVRTERPTIRIATASIVYRESRKRSPPVENSPVFVATPEDIVRAYNATIPKRYRILAGFTFDYYGEPVPIFIDRRYLLGYEGAHMNITGASGLATKTSYALFLIMCILTFCDDVAVIAMNVKEQDLLTVDRLPKDFDEAFNLIKERDIDPINIKLWRKASELGVDPYKILKRGYRIYVPGAEPSTRGAFNYYYGFKDMLDIGPFALNLFFDKEDLDDKMESLIFSVYEKYKEQDDASFNKLLRDLRELQESSGGRRRGDTGQWVRIGGTVHHRSTLSKFRNRVDYAIRKQLADVLTVDEARGKPIDVNKLKPGDFWVIDISKLHIKGQRLIFYLVLEAIHRKLEQLKYSGGGSGFPRRVVVFVDELNKFAPKGREYEAIKRRIVEITSRGRSVGLSLIGAQQLASAVDPEVLVNCSTYVVGWTHPHELNRDIYNWIEPGLKEVLKFFEKGELLIWHTVHKTPVRVRFPIPLHHPMGWE